MKQNSLIIIGLLLLLLLTIFPSAICAISRDDGKEKELSLNNLTVDNLTNGTIYVGQETPIRVSSSYTGTTTDKVQYEFSVNKDQKETVIRPYAEENNCVWTPTSPGVYYLVAKARSTETGLKGTTSVKVTAVNTDRLQIKKIGLSDSSETIETGKTVTITPEVVGGTEPYHYKINVQKVDSSGNQDGITSDSAKFEWTPSQHGTYRISVEITDNGGQIVKDEISEYIVLTSEDEDKQIKNAKTILLFCGGFFFIILGVAIIFVVNFINNKMKEKKEKKEKR